MKLAFIAFLLLVGCSRDTSLQPRVESPDRSIVKKNADGSTDTYKELDIRNDKIKGAAFNYVFQTSAINTINLILTVGPQGEEIWDYDENDGFEGTRCEVQYVDLKVNDKTFTETARELKVYSVSRAGKDGKPFKVESKPDNSIFNLSLLYSNGTNFDISSDSPDISTMDSPIWDFYRIAVERAKENPKCK